MIRVFLVFILFTANLFSQKININDINTNYQSGLSILEKEASQKGLSFILNGLEQAKAIDNDSLIGKGNYYLGTFFFKTEQYVESMDYFNKALILFTKTKNSIFISKCNRSLANIYKKQANFERALFHNYESLKINESAKSENEIAIDLNRIGSIYSRTKDFDAAKSRLEKALEINLSNNNLKEIVGNLSNLGAVFQRTNKLELALKYYKEGLIYADSLDLKIKKSILLGNIGSTNRSLEKYDLSLEYLFKALALKKELNRKGSAAHSCNDISETYIKMGKYNKAKEYALLAVEFARNENLESERYGYFLLSKSNFNLGNYKDSYSDLRMYNWLNDSIFNINKAATINELQIKYETEKRDLKIEAQESNIALLDEKDKVKNQWMLFGGVGLISIFGFIILYRSRNTAKRQQHLQEQFSQDLIKTQEEERTRVARELHDSVGQKLMLLTKKSKSSKNNDLESLAKNTLEELRSISRGLHPATIDNIGVTAAIESMINEVDTHTNIFFTNELDNIDTLLSKGAALHLYRIIQEVLNNLVKHAETKAAFITIKVKDKEITTTIKDNGKGFVFSNETKKKHSLGMKTLMERAKIIKSTLHIQTQPNKGTIVQLITPV